MLHQIVVGRKIIRTILDRISMVVDLEGHSNLGFLILHSSSCSVRLSCRTVNIRIIALHLNSNKPASPCFNSSHVSGLLVLELDRSLHTAPSDSEETTTTLVYFTLDQLIGASVRPLPVWPCLGFPRPLLNRVESHQ